MPDFALLILSMKIAELCDAYTELEEKYWDSQRLIAQYAEENEELKNNIDICKRERRFVGAVYVSRTRQHDDLKQILDQMVLENLRLRNKLTVEKIKRKECERYRDAYIDLYINEVTRK